MIKIFIIFVGVKVKFVGFKQLHLNMKQTFEFLYHLINGEILLTLVVKAVSFSAGKHLAAHDTTFSVSLRLFKV